MKLDVSRSTPSYDFTMMKPGIKQSIGVWDAMEPNVSNENDLIIPADGFADADVDGTVGCVSMETCRGLRLTGFSRSVPRCCWWWWWWCWCRWLAGYFPASRGRRRLFPASRNRPTTFRRFALDDGRFLAKSPQQQQQQQQQQHQQTSPRRVFRGAGNEESSEKKKKEKNYKKN